MLSLVLVFHQPCIVSSNIVPRIRKWDVGCRENHSVYSLWNISFSKSFCYFPFRQTTGPKRTQPFAEPLPEDNGNQNSTAPSPLWSNYGYFIMAGCNCSSHDYAPLSSSLCKENFAAINVCLWLFIKAPVKLFSGKHPRSCHVIKLESKRALLPLLEFFLGNEVCSAHI